MVSFISDLGLLFLIVLIAAFIIKLLRQPIIISYVIAGLIFSLVLAASSSTREQVVILSELGITFLLFLMGLEFNIKSFKFLGKDIIITTLWQSAVFFGIAFFLSKAFGFPVIQSLYISVLFMFSSTLLVAKWVEDKKDTQTLYGKIVLGTLVLQDLFVIISFTFLSLLNTTEAYKMMYLPIGGLMLLLVAYIFSKHLLNPLIKFTMRYSELMFIFSIGVCFFFVEVASFLGYSMTIGAFIGGLVLANTIYKNDIRSRFKPLTIFFTMLFFVGLGFKLDLGISLELIFFTLVLSILGLTIKPIIVYLTLRMRGYDSKTSVRAGLNLAQFSEFGLIIASAGIMSNAIPREIGDIAIFSVIITMVVSSYMIKYDNAIATLICKHLSRFDKVFQKKGIVSEQVDLNKYNTVFIGYYDLGKDLISKLENAGNKIFVIENEPANIEILKKEGIAYTYNSVMNLYFFDSLHFDNIKLLLSNLTDVEENLMILKKLKKDNPNAHIIVTAKNLNDSLRLYEAGVDYVLYPTYIKESHVCVLLEDYSKDINKLIEKKMEDIAKLKERHTKRESYNAKFYNWNDFLKRLRSKKPAKQQPERKPE